MRDLLGVIFGPGRSGRVGQYAPDPSPGQVFAAPYRLHAGSSVWSPRPPDQAGGRSSRWVPAGTPVAVGAIGVPDGMLYVGSRLPADPGSRDPGSPNAACLVDPGLDVAKSEPDRQGLAVPPLPFYAGMNPGGRLAYLLWLRGGRKDPGCGACYPALFLFGLERRLLVDGPQDAERDVLEAEVARLASVYGGRDAKLRLSASRLLEASAIARILSSGAEPARWRGFTSAYGLLPARLIAGFLLDARRPLPASLVLAFLRETTARTMGASAVRLWSPAAQGFAQALAARYASGYSPPLKRRVPITWEYRAYSPGLNVGFGSIPGRAPWPDPLHADWSDAEEVMEGVISGLVKREREIVDRVFAGPVARASRGGGTSAALREWLAAGPGAVKKVPADEYVLKLEGARDGKPTVAALGKAADRAAALGTGVEPDPLHTRPRPMETISVFVFDAPSAAAERPVGPAFLAAAALADAVLLTKDAIKHPGAAATFAGMVPMSAAEVLRLRAYLEFRAEQAPKAADLARKALSPGVPEMISKVLPAVVDSGRREEWVLGALKKAFDAARLDWQAAVEVLGPAAAPVGKRKGKKITPADPVQDAPMAPIDHGRVALIEAETAIVSIALAAALAEEDFGPAKPIARDDVTQIPKPPCGSRYPGLSSPAAALLEVLSSREIWSSAEYGAEARRHGLSPGGGGETINDWAFDRCGDPVLDIGDTVTVDPEALGRAVSG